MTLNSNVFPIITDLFISEGRCHYRIPVIAIDNLGRLVCLANGRMDTVADEARVVTLVCRRADRPKSERMVFQTLFGRDDWYCSIGSATVDDPAGQVLLSYYREPNRLESAELSKKQTSGPGHFQFRSSDGGKNWRQEPLNVKKNHMGYTGGSHGSAVGITLRYGRKKGRLLVPARFQTAPGEATETLQGHHYNCALYSDDHGQTWQTSEPVQVGTGEGCLVELSDGRIYYNSRAYFRDGKRRAAWSYDDGETFTDFGVAKGLTEPMNGGCNAGMVLYPPECAGGKDIILFSNPSGEKRVSMTVRASLDGGKSWPISRVIHKGPSAYSCLAAGSDGTIYVLYENGEKSPYEKISLAGFNLDWLTAV